MTRGSSRKHTLAAVVVCVTSITLFSCATVSRLHPPIQGETGALRLAEVMVLATRQEIVSLGINYEHLLASGIKDADLQDGSLVAGRVYCCGGSIEYSSAPWIYVPRGMSVEVGDLVEIKMGRQPRKNDPGAVNTAVRVRHKGISNAPCRWAPEQQGLWMRILHCDWMEKEGWIQKKGLYKTWLKPASTAGAK